MLDPFPRRPPGMSREAYAMLLAKYRAAMARLEASAAIASGRAEKHRRALQAAA